MLFFEKKMKTLFKRFDTDNNGTIDEKEFKKWADKLISFGKMTPEESEHLKKYIHEFWITFFFPADSNSDGSITIEELINHMTKVIN